MRNFVAALKLTSFALMCCVIVPPQMIILFFTKGKAAYLLPRFWSICVCLIFRIKITLNGAPERHNQVIYIGNHLSYLDIPAIGSVVNGSFIAKKDVAGWPVFGFLSKLQQTVFISRDREDAEAVTRNLENILKDDKNMIIFPEGTSTDGQSVYPFKSSLFSIFFKDNVKSPLIQPVSIKMITTNKKPITTQSDRDLYAWHIDMDTPLGKHLWLFAASRGAEIALTFHTPVNATSLNNRKALAKHCYDAVCKAI